MDTPTPRKAFDPQATKAINQLRESGAVVLAKGDQVLDVTFAAHYSETKEYQFHLDGEHLHEKDTTRQDKAWLHLYNFANDGFAIIGD